MSKFAKADPRKGGVNKWPSQITERPAPPAAISKPYEFRDLMAGHPCQGAQPCNCTGICITPQPKPTYTPTDLLFAFSVHGKTRAEIAEAVACYTSQCMSTCLQIAMECLPDDPAREAFMRRVSALVQEKLKSQNNMKA